MMIHRKATPEMIDEITRTGVINIELTAEEKRAAYLEETRAGRLEDAEGQFNEFVHCHFDGLMDEPDDKEGRFCKAYGFAPSDVTNPNSEHYLLEKFVVQYERHQNCYGSENDTWQAVIEAVLDRNVAVYKYPGDYAERCGELKLYRNSKKANEACKTAIEMAINGNYHNGHLYTDAAKTVVELFGMERVQYVLANTVHQKIWDARFSDSNKHWAATIVIHDDFSYGEDARKKFVVDKCHPGLTDMFITHVRNLATAK